MIQTRTLSLMFFISILVSCSKSEEVSEVTPAHPHSTLTFIIADTIPSNVSGILLEIPERKLSARMDLSPTTVGTNGTQLSLAPPPPVGLEHIKLTLEHIDKPPVIKSFDINLKEGRSIIHVEGLFSAGFVVQVDTAWAGEIIVRF